MLWEIGNQIQLTAELVAKDLGLDWSGGPVVATLTAADLRDWYQQIQHTAMWIQLHIRSHQSELYCVGQTRAEVHATFQRAHFPDVFFVIFHIHTWCSGVTCCNFFVQPVTTLVNKLHGPELLLGS